VLSWLAPLLVFGLVILVHELGHFVAAKLFGVYAPRFSIGFGPAIWRWRRGETEYVLGLFPLGGYVRMASREDAATVLLEGGRELSTSAAASPPEAGRRSADWDPEAMLPFGPRPVPENRWFESQPLWARLVILLAGVAMNALLAIVASSGVFALYGRPYAATVVDSVVPGWPAAAAGLQRGDSIVAVDGREVRSWAELTAIVSDAAGRELRLTVLRHGISLEVPVAPRVALDTSLVTGRLQQVGRIGVLPASRVERLGLWGSVAAGWERTWSMGGLVLRVVGGLVKGDVPLSQLGGPIAIARTSVAAARGGLATLFGLIAFLSINVAILNLLPIPILDGGQVLLNIAETIKGGAFSARTREVIMRLGLLAIVLLFVLVMFNDIKGLLKLFD
jgi:regulator of sigma E protease